MAAETSFDIYWNTDRLNSGNIGLKGCNADMPMYVSTTKVNHLGFAAIFLCIGIGLLFLKAVQKEQTGPGHWAIAFLLNTLGFVFWSGVLPLRPIAYYLAGEVCHFSGFLVLLCGVYLFTGHQRSIKLFFALSVIIFAWISGVALFFFNPSAATAAVRALRSALFFAGSFLVLVRSPKKEIRGRLLTGICFLLWGAYNLVYGFIRIEILTDLFFGILTGFQVLSAFGLMVMLTDRMRIRNEEKETRIYQLERLLPICAYCKKIRDKENQWQPVETYFEDRTQSQFSHGICPDCMEKNFPDYVRKQRLKAAAAGNAPAGPTAGNAPAAGGSLAGSAPENPK